MIETHRLKSVVIFIQTVPNMQLKKCTKCNNNQIEGDGHILSTCTINHGLISKRYDFLVNKLAKELVKSHPHAKDFRKRGWRSVTELLRPDITFIENKQCKIIEVTIPYEVNNSYLQQRKMEKNEET